MPQFDFAQVFAPPQPTDPPVSLASSDSPVFENANAISHHQDKPTSLVDGELIRSQWANLAFVGCAVLGALFCAFYFFGAADLLRSAAAWPRELLYQRPTLFNSGVKIPHSPNQSEQISNQNFRQRSDDGGDPFRNVSGPLTANPSRAFTSPGTGTPGSPTSPGSLPSADSILKQLPTAIPGSDSLSKIFNQGVADIAHAQALDAARRIVVLPSSVSQSSRHLTTRARSAVRQAGRAANTRSLAQQGLQNVTRARSTINTKTDSQTTIQNTAQSVTNTVQSTQASATAAMASQTANAARSMTSTAQQQLSTVRAIGGAARASASLGGGRH